MIRKNINHWEKIYSNKKQFIDWPWSELVGLVNKFLLSKKEKKLKVLELGFGTGPNIPYFLGLNFDYYGYELSKTAVQKVKKKFPFIKKNIHECDFSNLNSFGKNYDLIFDRGSMTHNNTKSIQRSISNSHKALKKGGIYIGTDWMTTKHSDFKNGRISSDKKTKNDFKKGSFVGVGDVHFFSKIEVKKLFSLWKIECLYQKNLIYDVPKSKFNYSTWVIVARKK